MEDLTCAFTGHRPSSYKFGYDEEHPDCCKLKALITIQIVSLIENGVTTFLSGMALGADIWGAEIVLACKKQYPQKGIMDFLQYLGREYIAKKNKKSPKESGIHAPKQKSRSEIIVYDGQSKENTCINRRKPEFPFSKRYNAVKEKLTCEQGTNKPDGSISSFF